MLMKLFLACSYQQTIQEHAFHLKKGQVQKIQFESENHTSSGEVGQRKVCTIKVPYPGTSSPDMPSCTVRWNACG